MLGRIMHFMEIYLLNLIGVKARLHHELHEDLVLELRLLDDLLRQEFRTEVDPGPRWS